MLIGLGVDAHRFAEVDGRPLLLGGVEVPHERGLDGHSDGDALCHALIDAILTPAGLGDVGTMFPAETTPPGANSLRLLARASQRVRAEAGLALVSADCVIVAQEPRLAAHLPSMAAVLAWAAGGRVTVKATTTDRMGFTGAGEGIACQVVALLDRAA